MMLFMSALIRISLIEVVWYFVIAFSGYDRLVCCVGFAVYSLLHAACGFEGLCFCWFGFA